MTNKTLDFKKADELNHDIIEGFIDKSYVSKESQKKINVLIETYSKNIFPLIMYKLTGLKLSVSEAKELWEGIVDHRYHLKKILRRDAGIYVASLDYLINIFFNNL